MDAPYLTYAGRHTMQGFADERDVMLSAVKRLGKYDEDLRQTNVYNDSFYIWHDGLFGTINGFRLGRLPLQTVEWSEINAAWGQVVLLLDTMVKQKGFQFARHRLIPQGSFSKVVEGATSVGSG
jgi:beclin 1